MKVKINIGCLFFYWTTCYNPQHSPRVVVADGCSASTAVLHLASKVLGDLGMPIGTICDTPKAKEDTVTVAPGEYEFSPPPMAGFD